MDQRVSSWVACVVVGLVVTGQGVRGVVAAEPEQKSPASPLEPVSALAEFQLNPRFRIEIAAAEPQVVDPVAVRFDENGRMWVVEMGDYPNGPVKGGRPLSRVRWLEDTDGDGRYETSRVFADGLLFATGIQPWDKGVLVTIAGELIYLVDSDGDGVADQRETWYSGFKQENPQLRANHPTFAIDNRIYVANGLRGGVVGTRRAKWAGVSKPVAISSRDFRFDPRSGVCDAVNGNGQFGLTFDDLGRRFVCSNRNPCRHVVLGGEYLKANPHLAVSEVMQDVVTPGAGSRIHPISKIWVTSNLHEGQFTAACGVTAYRGSLLGDDLRGNMFTCDPTGNLVHRETLVTEGVSLKGKPGRKGVEFLASRDEWFRPVNMEVGPDGALYIVDMYRAVVEHPQWVPAELKNRPDNYSGNDRGRIYRIVPADHATGNRDDAVPGLGRLKAARLVDELRSPTGWRRDTAARLIYQRQNKQAIHPLLELAGDKKEVVGRIHALWALRGLGALSVGVIGDALTSGDDNVVIHALRLCEKRLKTHPELWERVDVSRLTAPELRFQWLLSQAHHPGWSTKAEAKGLAKAAVAVCLKRPCDRWTRVALVAACGRHGSVLLDELISAWAGRDKVRFAELRQLVGMIAETIGRHGNAREVVEALAMFESGPGTNPAWLGVYLSGMAGLDTGLAGGGRSLGNPPGDFGRQRLNDMWARIIQWSVRPPEAGMGAVATQLLSSGPEAVAVPALIKQFDGGSVDALRSLARFPTKTIGDVVLARYSRLSAEGRRAALDVMIANPGRAILLIDAVSKGVVSRADLDPGRVDRLRRHSDEVVRQKSKSVLADLVPKARRDVLKRYATILSAQGNPQKGREVFRKNCTACHRVDRLGVDVAPDISDTRRWTRQQLLVSILDPNRVVDSNYFAYSLVTQAGVVHTGLVASETPSAVSLRQPEGKTLRVLRADIDVLKSNGISLMPEGLEKNVNPGQMADLLSFLKNWRYLDGRIPVQLPSR